MIQPTDDLAARIQRLEDIHEIQRLRAWYHRYINDCEFEKIHHLFTDDGVADIGYPQPKGAFGREAVRASMESIPVRLGQVKQFLHSHTVDEVDGDTAKGWTMIEARYGKLDGKAYNVALRYDDEYQRVDGRWLFKSMRGKFYFSTPHLSEGWASPERHHLVNREGFEVPHNIVGPNPPV
jgi:hypothetical protein